MNQSLKEKYGSTALIAGGSEGIGAAFAEYLAAEGINLALVARDKKKLKLTASKLREQYKITVLEINVDLSDSNAVSDITKAVRDIEIDILVHNAAMSYIGKFDEAGIEHNNDILRVNVESVTGIVSSFAKPMLHNNKGAIILMSSLAGFQGSGYLAIYAASKAYIRVLAEGLWYEWNNTGVDIIACCAGATSSPNYLKTNPGSSGFFAPKVQAPHQVVKECFKKLGKRPTYVTGFGNRFASFVMHRLLPRKNAIKIMGDTTSKLYGLNA